MGAVKKTIRIGATEEEPFVYSCFADYPARCPYFGTDLEFIYDVLVNMFNLNIVWKEYMDFNELYHALDSGEIDLIGNTLGSDLHHNRSWLQTDTAVQLSLAFFVKSSTVPLILNPLKIIKWDLWLCIVASSVCVYMLDKFVARNRPRLAFLASKFFHFLWFFILLLIMEFYGNIFTTDLITTTKSAEIFKDLNDLGEKLLSKECSFVIFDKYVGYEDFDIVFKPQHNLSWSNSFKIAFKTNPPIQVKMKDDMLAFVRNSSCAIGLDLISPDTELYCPLCDIAVKVFTEDLPYRAYGYYHTIESMEDYFKLMFKSAGFSDISNDLLKRYFKHQIKSFYTGCESSTSDSYYILTLQKMSFCFVILIIGISLSSAINLVQMMRSHSLLMAICPIRTRRRKYSLNHSHF